MKTLISRRDPRFSCLLSYKALKIFSPFFCTTIESEKASIQVRILATAPWDIVKISKHSVCLVSEQISERQYSASLLEASSMREM